MMFEVVTVQEQNGFPLGRGFINQNSKIRVRMLTRDASQEIDAAFLEMRESDWSSDVCSSDLFWSITSSAC